MIDWTRVCDLRSEIGAEDFADIVTMFLEEADEVIARLSGAAGARALESDLHFLKGSALNLGFADFAARCQDGERRAAQGDASFSLTPLLQSYAGSKVAFEQGLDQAIARHRAAS